MENQIQTPDVKGKSIPRWLQIFLLVGGVILIVTGLMSIFGGTASSALVDKFNEFKSPTAQAANDLQNVSNLLVGIAAKEQAKDYAGAVTDLQTALTKLNDVDSLVKTLKSLASEFGDIVNRLSDQNAKTAGLHFVDVSNSRNTAVLKMTDDTRQLINLVLPYYEALVNGKTATLDEPKLTAKAEQVNADTQLVAKTNADLDLATQDLAKAANFTLVKK